MAVYGGYTYKNWRLVYKVYQNDIHMLTLTKEQFDEQVKEAKEIWNG